MASPQHRYRPAPPHQPTTAFQMQYIKDGVVVFAVERDSPSERQVRDMTAECVRAGAHLNQLRLVSKDSDLYDDVFSPRTVN